MRSPAGRYAISRLRGFTLLEVLVAMLVMGLAFQALVQISGTSARAERSLANTIERDWELEGAALEYLAALHQGETPTSPDGLSVRFQPSTALEAAEIAQLAAGGWRLMDLRLSASSSGEMVWQGSLLLPMLASPEGGGAQ